MLLRVQVTVVLQTKVGAFVVGTTLPLGVGMVWPLKHSAQLFLALPITRPPTWIPVKALWATMWLPLWWELKEPKLPSLIFTFRRHSFVGFALWTVLVGETRLAAMELLKTFRGWVLATLVSAWGRLPKLSKKGGLRTQADRLPYRKIEFLGVHMVV